MPKNLKNMIPQFPRITGNPTHVMILGGQCLVAKNINIFISCYGHSLMCSYFFSL